MFQKDQDIFKVLLGAVSEAVIVVDEHQSIVEINESAEILFGYTRIELIKQPLNILIPKNYHAEHGNHFTGFMKEKERRQMGHGRDIYGARKDGSTFPVEAGLNPFTIYDKNYVMALVIDITERKVREQERLHLATIFNESLNEIYIFDTKTLKFINVNYGAQKNIGYSLEELKKMTPVSIKPGYNETDFRDTIKVLLKKDLDKIVFETIHQRKNGTTYPVEVHLQLSNLGEKAVFVAIILDITDRKNYTEKLENKVEERTEQLKVALSKEKELNELKTQFLSLVSHEFKTPLSGILTSSVLLSKYTLSDQQQKRDKHIKIIADKVQFLNSILNDFLSLERLEAGKLNYNFSHFKLSKVIDEVIYNANMLLKKGQSIKYPDDIDDFSLFQDEKSITIILSNLVYNAIAYSQEDKTIAILVTQNDTETTIKIKDDGIGIPIKDQNNIFDRYYRAENVSTIQGTGIGLNIVKSHLENLGGTINFKSKENSGTTFTITIPNTAIT